MKFWIVQTLLRLLNKLTEDILNPKHLQSYKELQTKREQDIIQQKELTSVIALIERVIKEYVIWEICIQRKISESEISWEVMNDIEIFKALEVSSAHLFADGVGMDFLKAYMRPNSTSMSSRRFYSMYIHLIQQIAPKYLDYFKYQFLKGYLEVSDGREKHEVLKVLNEYHTAWLFPFIQITCQQLLLQYKKSLYK